MKNSGRGIALAGAAAWCVLSSGCALDDRGAPSATVAQAITVGPERAVEPVVYGAGALMQQDAVMTGFDGVSLVVWRDDRAALRGTRVRAGGEVLDATGLDLGMSSDRPAAVTHDGARWWVAALDATTRLRLLTVERDGAVRPRAVGPAELRFDPYTAPSVSWSEGRALVLWRQWNPYDSGLPTSVLVGRRWSESEGFDADPMALGPDNLGERGVVARPGGWSVVWSQRAAYGVTATLHARRVAATLAPLTTSESTVTPPDDVNRLSLSVRDGRAVLAWTELRYARVHLTPLRDDGSFGDDALLDDTTSIARPAWAPTPSGWLLFWRGVRTYGDPVSLLVRSFGADLRPTGPAWTVGPYPGLREFTAGWDGVSARALWQPTSDAATLSSLRHRAVSADGAPSGEPVLPLAQAPNPQRNPTVAWDGHRYLVAWVDDRDAITSPRALHVAPDGRVVEREGVSLWTSTDRLETLSASCGATRCVVVGDGSYHARMWGALLDPLADGVAPRSTGCFGDLSCGVDGGAFVEPVVASSGGRHVIAWNSRGLRVAMIDDDGNALGATVARYSYDATRSVAGDGRGFVVGTTMMPEAHAGGLSITIEGGDGAPGLAWSGARYLALRASDRGLRAVRLDGLGARDGAAEVTLTTAALAERAWVVFQGAAWLVGWREGADRDRGPWRARWVSAAGALVGDAFSLGLDGASSVRAASDGAGSVLLVYSRDVTDRGVVVPRVFARLMTSDRDARLAGAVCTAHSECASGHCVDGVCCDTACGGGVDDCQACSAAEGGSVDGVCAPRAAGVVCRAAAGACDVAERCDGARVTCPGDALAPDGSACGDGLRCNGVEACRAGVCATTYLSCDDRDACTDDRCDEARGCVHARIAECCSADAHCDDGVACTRDQCIGDRCRHLRIAGCCLDSASCDDGDPATVDVCDRTLRQCDHRRAASDAGTPDARDAGVSDAGDGDGGGADGGSPDAGAAPTAAGCQCDLRAHRRATPGPWLAALALACGARRRRPRRSRGPSARQATRRTASVP